MNRRTFFLFCYLRALVLLFFVLGLVSLAVFGTRGREGPGGGTPELVAIVLLPCQTSEIGLRLSVCYLYLRIKAEILLVYKHKLHMKQTHF